MNLDNIIRRRLILQLVTSDLRHGAQQTTRARESLRRKLFCKICTEICIFTIPFRKKTCRLIFYVNILR